MTAPESANGIRKAVGARQVLASDVAARALARIDALDPQLRFALHVPREYALRRAREIDDRVARGEPVGPLAGVPLAVKDNLCTSFAPTTCASRILSGFRAPYDAHVVELLERAGAVIVCKTNLDEFAMGSSTENSAVGPSRNPWDTQRVPGGSSGGSVAAVAARVVPIALGSDTGGSIRQPSALCGVTGLKPTYGRVSRYGLVAFASSLDQVGPITVDASDAALALTVIAGHDQRDSTSVATPAADYQGEIDVSLAHVRLGVPREYFGDGLADETRAAVEAAIKLYHKLGAQIVEVSLPNTPYCIACYYLICTAEASSNLARYDGVHYGYRSPHARDYIEVYSRSRDEGFGAEVKRRIMLGTYALSSGYYDAYYLRALKVRTLIRNDFMAAFKQCDLLISPTTPAPAFKLGEKLANPLELYLSDIYTVSANLAGIPAISVPAGFSRTGLPIGMQLLGPHFAELSLLQAAAAFQRETDWHTRVPPVHAE